MTVFIIQIFRSNIYSVCKRYKKKEIKIKLVPQVNEIQEERKLLTTRS